MRSGGWRLGARFASALVMACAGSLAQAQPFGGDAPFAVMPGSAQWRASLPAMPHEQHPDTWPQPDYFTSALALTGRQASTRVKSLAVRTGAASAVDYIALPVQTQAFGFAPVFNALVGAELDWLIGASGLRAMGQTDVMDAYGPMVRRLDAAAVDAVARQHPKEQLLGLYLGHDGVNHAFITLVVRSAEGRRVSHKTVDLPDDREKALSAIASVLPEVLRKAGLKITEAAPTPEKAQCTLQTWALADLPADASLSRQACHALVLGTLLPVYGVQSDPQLSPAKLAWLAKAHVLAKRGLDAAGTGGAIQKLAAIQLEWGAPVANALPLVKASDPVISRVASVVSLSTRLAGTPVRSQDEAKARELVRLQDGLPALAGHLLHERSYIVESFSRVDFCGIELRFPGAMPNLKCQRDPDVTYDKPTRPASQAEKLLYQDWRVAAGFKDLHYYSVVQGRSDQAEETLQRLPTDVREHPYVQRVKYMFAHASKVKGDFDALLKRSRATVKDFVQSTVNYQYNSAWLAGYSLTEHAWTDNFNVLNDAEVSADTAVETRLLAVMKFDRFGLGPLSRHSVRKVGEPAFFLAPSVADVRMASMPGMLDIRPAPAAQVASGQAAVAPVIQSPNLFSLHMDFTDEIATDELQKRLAASPQSLEWRTEIALAMLKEGASMSEALKLIDARMSSRRTDDRVSESHAWAYPAHAFIFAGEPDAAKKYYQRVASIGSGSESDMLARVRVPLIEGRLADALVASQARMSRYDSEFAWFDTVNLLFLTGQKDRAWSLFMEQAASAEYAPIWTAPMTGHRMQGLDLAGVKDWLTRSKFNEVQVNGQDAAMVYLHMQAVVDRLPGDSDVALLREPRGKWKLVDERWGSSARLHRAALENLHLKEAYDYALSKATWDANGRNDFALPVFTWVAAQVTNGKDRHLDQVRKATMRWDFDNILAKSMLLALEGQTKESLSFFRAARIRQAQLGLGDDRLVQRAVPASYHYALGGYLMYRKTGELAYRDETLRFVRAYQHVFPQFAWLYGMESALEPDPKRKQAAACRARALDAKSYFLSLAGSELASGRSCAAK